jgi:hypothetical protein
MQLSKWIKLMAFITLLSLIYIHLQMKIFDLAYQAKRNEHKIQMLRDENGVSTYYILSLKSVSHIGEKLLDQESAMQFISNDKVYEMASSQETVKSSLNKSAKASIGNLSFNFQKWLTVSTPQAEARLVDRK